MCVFVHQEKEMEKQKILYQQARLHARGAAEMVLQMISSSKGNDLFLTQLRSWFTVVSEAVLQQKMVALNPLRSKLSSLSSPFKFFMPYFYLFVICKALCNYI